MREVEIFDDGFEVIRDTGRYVVKRHNAHLAKVLEVRDRMKRNKFNNTAEVK